MPIHLVSYGDTISGIAVSYGVTQSRLLYDNQISADDPLVPGQALLVLLPEVVHQIAPGESLYSIANTYGTTQQQLLRNNPYLIATGYQSENIPVGTAIVIRYREDPELAALPGQSGVKPEAVFGGYAYPFIQPEILRESLLYLSELFLFSYGFTAEGSLVPLEDEGLLQAAGSAGVSPVLVLTPLDESGVFNSTLVHQLVSDPAIQQRLLEELTATVQQKDYEGVDIDFEYIEAADREGYVQFVANVTARMNPLGRRVSVALAPKERADWPGLLYEGIDYAALGAAANQVLVMTYEWGYTYGPPLAVAPLNRVRAVLDYAVSAIPREKVNLGIPNYAYDWPLPYIRGETAAENISNVEAVRRAGRFGAVIQFDTEAQSPFFEYTSEGVRHVVWFEDVRSIRAKLRLIAEYGLMGADYWSLMKPFRANWLLLNAMYEIK